VEIIYTTSHTQVVFVVRSFGLCLRYARSWSHDTGKLLLSPGGSVQSSIRKRKTPRLVKPWGKSVWADMRATTHQWRLSWNPHARNYTKCISYNSISHCPVLDRTYTCEAGNTGVELWCLLFQFEKENSRWC